MTGEPGDRGIRESGDRGIENPGTGSDLFDPAARAAYVTLWKESPQRTPFAHPAYAEAVAATFGYPVEIVQEGTAAALVYPKRRGPLRAAALPPLAPTAAPILAEDASSDGLTTLLTALEKKSHQATFILPFNWNDGGVFAAAGWTTTERHTYVSLLPEGADPAAWSANARRVAKKAGGLYTIEEDARHVGAAVRLMTASYRRSTTPFGIEDGHVERVARALMDAGLARCFGAVPVGGGEAEAALVVAHDDRAGYYWIPGSVPGPAMTALLAAALPRLAADGLAHFDWCGANTPSIAEFKRRFGPTLTPVVRARWVRPGAARLLDRLRGGA